MKKIYTSVISLLLSMALLPVPAITAAAENAAEENPAVTVQDEIRFYDDFENGYIPVDYTVENADWTDSGKAVITDGSLTKNVSLPVDTWDGSIDTSWYSDTKTNYDITTAEQLAGISYLANVSQKKFKNMTFNLMVDIDLNNINWAPIGTAKDVGSIDTLRFEGTLNGNGHIIKNIKVNTSANLPHHDGSYPPIAVGLFGNLYGTVTDLGIVGMQIVDDESTGAWAPRMGGLAGKTIGATASSVYIKDLTLNRGYNSRGLFGGLTGFAQGFNVTDCYVSNLRVNRTRQDMTGGAAVMYAGINLTNVYVTGSALGGNTAAGLVALNAAQYVSDTVPSVTNSYSVFKQAQSGSPLQNASLNAATYEATTAQMTSGLVKDGSKFRADTGNVNGGAPVFKSTEDKLEIKAKINSADATSVKLSAQSLATDVFSINLPAGEGEYDVKVVLDKTTMTYKTYINGTENTSLSGALACNYTYINDIAFDVEGSATVDNISLSVPVENKDVIVDELNNAMPADLDYVYESFELPEKTGEYKIEWKTSDNNVISIRNGEAIVNQKYYTQKVVLTALVKMSDSAANYKNSQIKVDYNITVPAINGIDDPNVILDEIERTFLTDSLITDEALSSITKNLKTLPTELDGITFTWSVSEDQNVLTADGTVTRPAENTPDVPVELKVEYTLGDVTREKIYNLVVTAPLTTEYMLDEAWKALTEADITDQPVHQIRNNITLPSTGKYDTEISWTSSRPEVIAINGGVTRTTTDEEVCLTATFTLNGQEADNVKEFWFIVERTARTKADEDFDAITFDETEVTADFIIPLTGRVNSQTISWESNNSAISINSNRAVVTRPASGEGDATVTLTAKITCEEALFTRTFTFTVPEMPSDEEILTELISGITVDTITDEDPMAVRENLSLPQSFDGGITCTWSVSPEGAVDPVTGTITRPGVGEPALGVTLTPTLTKGSASVTGTPLSISILAFDEPAQVLEKAKSELTFNAISDEPIDLVANDLTLPTNWKYGTTITWSSNDGVHLIIRENEADPTVKIGDITRPGYIESGVDVLLTATLSYEGETVTKTFRISISEMAGNVSSAYYDFEDTTLEEQITKRKLLTAPSSMEGGSSSFDLELCENPDEPGDTVLAMKRYPSHTSSGQLRWETSVRTGIMVFDVDLKLLDVPTSGLQISAAFTPGGTTRLITKILADGSVVLTSNSYSDAVPTDRWFNYQIWADIPNWEYWVVVDGVRLNAEPLPLNGDKTGLSFWVYEMAWTNDVTHDHTLLIDDWSVYRYVDYAQEFTDAVERFELAFLSRNNIGALTGDLVIPTVDSDSIKTILTSSSNTTVMTNSGTVTRSNTDKTVQFTVDFTNVHGGTRQKVYNIVVKGFDYTDDGEEDTEAPVADDLTAVRKDMVNVESDIKKNYNVSQITGNIVLPTSGANGTTITWDSSDEAVISDSGVITRSNVSKTVTLTYTVKRNGVTDVGTIDVTVAAQIGTPVVIPQGGGSVTVDRGGSSSAPSAPVATVPPVKATTFTDVPKNFWGYDAIEALYEKGVIDGVGDGKFDTTSSVTREALVKMILLALDVEVPETTDSSFADLDANDWSLPYVEVAYKEGIIGGIGDGLFGKGVAITRQDICVIIYRALSARGLIAPAESESFADGDLTADYAKEAASALKAAGIVNGDDDNRLNPTANATRAEAAQFIYNCISYIANK